VSDIDDLLNHARRHAELENELRRLIAKGSGALHGNTPFSATLRTRYNVLSRAVEAHKAMLAELAISIAMENQP
jgi:hypothetical protein